MLIGGTSTPPQSLPTQRRVLYGIDESELAKGVRRREKKESIRERAKAVVESRRLALNHPPPSSIDNSFGILEWIPKPEAQ